MEQVQRAHIERCRDRNAAAQLHQPLGELDPAVPVVQAPVDVRRGDRHQFARPEDLGHAHHDSHRELGRGAGGSIEQAVFVVSESQF